MTTYSGSAQIHIHQPKNEETDSFKKIVDIANVTIKCADIEDVPTLKSIALTMVGIKYPENKAEEWSILDEGTYYQLIVSYNSNTRISVAEMNAIQSINHVAIQDVYCEMNAAKSKILLCARVTKMKYIGDSMTAMRLTIVQNNVKINHKRGTGEGGDRQSSKKKNKETKFMLSEGEYVPHKK
jgi:hypothetical protein